jgi:glyoxylate reductase
VKRTRIVVGAPLVGDAVGRLTASTEDRAEIAILPAHAGREDFVAAVRDAAALVAMPTQRIDASLLAHAADLRIVANHAVGVDNVDLEAARARGIVVTNTPGVLTEATADLAFGLILDACRRITEGDRRVRAGAWRGWTPAEDLGRRVHGATLGIVGFGRIGRAVTRRARGFAMKILYTSRTPATPAVEAELGATFRPLDTLLQESDVVSLHAPATAATRGLLDRRRLAAMRPGAILVNTARGALVDETALAELLHEGHLAGAALDVYDGEPRIAKALLEAPRLVLAPHIGSAESETRAAMADLACGAILTWLEGRAIDPEIRVV